MISLKNDVTSGAKLMYLRKEDMHFIVALALQKHFYT